MPPKFKVCKLTHRHKVATILHVYCQVFFFVSVNRWNFPTRHIPFNFLSITQLYKAAKLKGEWLLYTLQIALHGLVWDNWCKNLDSFLHLETSNKKWKWVRSFFLIEIQFIYNVFLLHSKVIQLYILILWLKVFKRVPCAIQ